MSDRLPRGRMVALYEAQRAELNALYEHGTPVLPQGCVLEGPPSITLSDGFFYGDVGQQRVLRRAKMAVLAVSLSACEGADENSLLSRPGHARATKCCCSAVGVAAQVGMRARSATARCKDQIAAEISCYCACVQKYHDGGCLCGAHGARAVWIATSFRLRPRMHKHANAWWSLQLFACRNDV